MSADLSNLPRTLWWEDATGDRPAGLYVIDQSRLPIRGDVLCCQTLEGIKTAITSMAVRGAPALGVAAALALALYSENESQATNVNTWLEELDAVANDIAALRPTAINLSAAAFAACDYAHSYVADADNNTASESLDVVVGTTSEPAELANATCAASPRLANATGIASSKPENLAATTLLELAKAALVGYACSKVDEDETINRAMGINGAARLAPGSRVMTFCNAGSLATAFFGTALGVIYSAFDQDKIDHVWVCETRPLGQGARLTTWELMCAGVPNTLITDSMAASVMSMGWVDAVIVGADRICANGDVANKIGTLSLALAAKHYAIPFYVCAPTSTIDKNCASAAEVPIEQRDPRELMGTTCSGVILPDDPATTQAFDLLTAKGAKELKFSAGHEMLIERKGGAYAFDGWFRTTPPNCDVYNPAFDVTPANLITAIITENGTYKPANILA